MTCAWCQKKNNNKKSGNKYNRLLLYEEHIRKMFHRVDWPHGICLLFCRERMNAEIKNACFALEFPVKMNLVSDTWSGVKVEKFLVYFFVLFLFYVGFGRNCDSELIVAEREKSHFFFTLLDIWYYVFLQKYWIVQRGVFISNDNYFRIAGCSFFGLQTLLDLCTAKVKLL